MLQGETHLFQWLTGQGRPVWDMRIEQNTLILLGDYIGQKKTRIDITYRDHVRRIDISTRMP